LKWIYLFSLFLLTTCQIDYSGRFNYLSDGSGVQFDWSGVSFQYTFTGTSVSMYLTDTANQYTVTVDQTTTLLTANSNTKNYVLASGLSSSGNHTVHVLKRTEPSTSYNGVAFFGGFSINGGSPIVKPNSPKTGRRLEFWGDSITTGYGDLGTDPNCAAAPTNQNVEVTYAVDTAKNVSAEYHIEAWAGKGVVRNWDSTGITDTDPLPLYLPSTTGNNLSLKWNWSSWIPNGVVINLGLNDFGHQPVPDQTTFTNGYLNMIAMIRDNYSSTTEIFTICMAGNPCCQYITDMVNQLKQQGDSHITYVEISYSIFVYPDDYGCASHPNAKGHQKMANVLIPVIKKQLGW